MAQFFGMRCRRRFRVCPGLVSRACAILNFCGESRVLKVTMLQTSQSFPFEHTDAGLLTVSGLPEGFDTTIPAVLRFGAATEPCICRTEPPVRIEALGTGKCRLLLR